MRTIPLILLASVLSTVAACNCGHAGGSDAGAGGGGGSTASGGGFSAGGGSTNGGGSGNGGGNTLEDGGSFFTGPNPCVDAGDSVDYNWSLWPAPADIPDGGSYVLAADTVTDTVTKLVWQRNPPLAAVTLDDATTYCAGLALEDAGWRLPTLIELESIVSYGVIAPAIDSAAFPTQSAKYWTSTEADIDFNWIVDFGTGATDFEEATHPFPARCVKAEQAVFVTDVAGAPCGRYLISANTVFDAVTQLTWQRVTTAQQSNLPGANEYCTTLMIDSMGGWRLPTVKELQSLFDFRGQDVGIDTTAFPDTQTIFPYWSSTLWVMDPIDNWVVDMALGGTQNNAGIGASFVRCVR